MRTLIILLLMAAPASGAWDLNNLTPSQRNALIVIRDSWNNGFRGTPRCKTGCGAGVIKHQWYDGKVKDAVPARRARPAPGPARSYGGSYGGGPETVLNPFVSEAEGGGGGRPPAPFVKPFVRSTR